VSIPHHPSVVWDTPKVVLGIVAIIEISDVEVSFAWIP
jgi:hypothetical protein